MECTAFNNNNNNNNNNVYASRLEGFLSFHGDFKVPYCKNYGGGGVLQTYLNVLIPYIAFISLHILYSTLRLA
jgi:hypothetical protein